VNSPDISHFRLKSYINKRRRQTRISAHVIHKYLCEPNCFPIKVVHATAILSVILSAAVSIEAVYSVDDWMIIDMEQMVE
jgi:hypothetical protein